MSGKFKCELCGRRDAELQWFDRGGRELYICGGCKKIADGEFCAEFLRYIFYAAVDWFRKNMVAMTDEEFEMVNARLVFVCMVVYFLDIYENRVLKAGLRPGDNGMYEIPIGKAGSKSIFNHVFVCDPVDRGGGVKTFKFGLVKRTAKKKTLKDIIGVEMWFSKKDLGADPVVNDRLCSAISNEHYKIDPVWMVISQLHDTTMSGVVYMMTFARENLPPDLNAVLKPKQSED